MTTTTIKTPKQQFSERKLETIKRLFKLNPGQLKLLMKFLQEFETKSVFYLGKQLRAQLALEIEVSPDYLRNILDSLVKAKILEMKSYKHYSLNEAFFPETRIIKFADETITFELYEAA